MYVCMYIPSSAWFITAALQQRTSSIPHVSNVPQQQDTYNAQRTTITTIIIIKYVNHVLAAHHCKSIKHERIDHRNLEPKRGKAIGCTLNAYEHKYLFTY